VELKAPEREHYKEVVVSTEKEFVYLRDHLVRAGFCIDQNTAQPERWVIIFATTDQKKMEDFRNELSRLGCSSEEP
jgi:hypothetical protein